jgi:hypothetical protein
MISNVYFYTIGACVFVLSVFAIVLWTMPKARVMTLKQKIRKLDVIFDLDHPTQLGEPIVHHQTTVGGFFTMALFFLMPVFAAYVLHTWVLALYTIVEEYKPNLVQSDFKAADSRELFIDIQFLGIDNLVSCALACDSYISSASSSEVPTFSANMNTSTYSKFSTRKACVGADASTAASLGCGSTSPSVGSRVYLWTEGLLGRFQCTSSTIPSSAGGASVEACGIRFYPNPIESLPTSFIVHFSLPLTRAAAIAWNVHGDTFGSVDVGAKGILRSEGGLFYGSKPSVLSLSMRPFSWNNSVSLKQFPNNVCFQLFFSTGFLLLN